MYYVYRFLDKKKNIIYVGKSKQDLEQRFRGHLHLPGVCYDLTYKIEYIECSTESDMSIKEIFYINKYRHDGVFFNILDMTDIPVSVEFNDKWKQYKGPLGSHFHHSVNYLKGYTTQKGVRYNKDGTVDRRKTNKKAGISSFVEGFSANEVDLIVDHLIAKLNNAENNKQEEICFRNLAIFILGVNIPHKSNDFLSMRYCDLFDENDCPKPIELKLNRSYKDEIMEIPQRDAVKKIITAYVHYCGLNYKSNATDAIFLTREHQLVSTKTWSYIVKEAAKSVGIEKNIAAEAIRKTYGLNIFNTAKDKLNALVFLEKLWGGQQYGNIIAYLNLADDHIDYDYYFGETFALGDVDISRIECLQPHIAPGPLSQRVITIPKTQEQVANDIFSNPQPIQMLEKRTKTNRLWPREKKLEVVLMHLEQHIPQKDLAKQYGVDSANICRWVSEYKKYGDTVFEDKRFKQKK